MGECKKHSVVPSSRVARYIERNPTKASFPQLVKTMPVMPRILNPKNRENLRGLNYQNGGEIIVSIAHIQDTITSLNFAGDVAKSLQTLGDVRGKVIGLQSSILSAQRSAQRIGASTTALRASSLRIIGGSVSLKPGTKKQGGPR